MMFGTTAVFFNASEKDDAITSGTYRFFGEGSRSVASAGHTILQHEFVCPGGEKIEDLHHEDMAGTLKECSINDSGKVRKLSHIEINALVTYFKSL